MEATGQSDDRCEVWKQANEDYAVAVKADKTQLDAAYRSGQALQRLKDSLPKGVNWKDELAEHFDGKPRTDRLYRFVAEHWNDPAIEKARLDGKPPESIGQFQKLLRQVPDPIRAKKKEEEKVFRALVKDAMGPVISEMRALHELELPEYVEVVKEFVEDFKRCFRKNVGLIQLEKMDRVEDKHCDPAPDARGCYKQVVFHRDEEGERWDFRFVPPSEVTAT